MTEILSRDDVKGKKGFNDLKFGTFIARFWSDGAPSMAVKELKGPKSKILNDLNRRQCPNNR